MHPNRILFLLLFYSIPAIVSGQTRAVGARAFVLDDGSGNTITFQTPLSGWTGNIPFQLPIPPPGNPLAGFVHLGTTLDQILYWNPSDGVQGAWDAGTIASLGGITGTGTSGMIPLWTGTATQANSHLAEHFNTTGAYSTSSAGEQLAATDATATNVSIAITPEGNGALQTQIADGTTTGGNARGQYAVDWQMVRGTAADVASGNYATVGGGGNNTASGVSATIGGGNLNTASGSQATVSGGGGNTASGSNSFVGGSQGNTASGSISTVVAGWYNTASGDGSFSGGGGNNTASQTNAVVTGGSHNVAGGINSAIGGGDYNTANGLSAVVSGGHSNSANGTYASVGGGAGDVASGSNATVSGGGGNTASGLQATVSGGAFNAASGSNSFVGGSQGNTASGSISTVVAGWYNNASGDGSFIGGGGNNTSSQTNAVVTGGSHNAAGGINSAIGGGAYNSAGGDNSAVPGGDGLTFSSSASGSFGFLGGNTGSNGMTVAAPNTSLFGNTDLWLANNDNTARALYFYAPYNTAGAFPNGDNYVGFKAGAVTTSVIWTLPLADGTANQVLQTDGAGNLSWTNGGLTHITESYFTSGQYSATSTGEQLMATDASATDISIALQPKGAGALEAQIADGTATGGNARGLRAVDWQTARIANTQVASGTHATVSGGFGNTASAIEATVSGGYSNTASGIVATVSGGYTNTASGVEATVSGGYTNTASGDYSAIPGGENLTLSGHDDFGFLGLNDGTGNAMSIAANNVSVFGNTDLWLANNDGTQRAIKFFDQYSTAGAFPNTAKYVGFEAPNAVTTSTIWKLPVADGSANQVLQTDGAGNLSWSVLQALDVYNTSSEAVTSGSAVPFSTTQFSSGSVTFGSSTNATIGIAGNYRVEFSVYPTAAATYELQKNGTAIASSVVSCAASTLTHYSTLITCAASDVITLVNASGASSTLDAGGTAVDASLEITLIK